MATTIVSLQQAIGDVETAQSQLTNDQQVQATAAASVATAQAKLDSANSSKSAADTTVASDTTSFNATLDELIAAATAAKL